MPGSLRFSYNPYAQLPDHSWHRHPWVVVTSNGQFNTLGDIWMFWRCAVLHSHQVTWRNGPRWLHYSDNNNEVTVATTVLNFNVYGVVKVLTQIWRNNTNWLQARWWHILHQSRSLSDMRVFQLPKRWRKTMKDSKSRQKMAKTRAKTDERWQKSLCLTKMHTNALCSVHISPYVYIESS